MRPVRDRRPPNLYGEWVNITSDRPAPNSASEALKSHKKKDWRSAMEDKIKSLNDNDVFDLVDIPDGKRRSVANGCLMKKSQLMDQLND